MLKGLLSNANGMTMRKRQAHLIRVIDGRPDGIPSYFLNISACDRMSSASLK